MYPVCSTGVYCPLTDGCELKCFTGFGTLALNSTINHTCDTTESFCSYEESCKSNVETPGSFSGIKLTIEVIHYLKGFFLIKITFKVNLKQSDLLV